MREATITPWVPISVCCYLERPYSQWAVYTQYQDLKRVNGYTVHMRGSLPVLSVFALRADLDFNWITVENGPEVFYPFYQLDVAWTPSPTTALTLGLTNRGMNLDIHYPTYYYCRGSVMALGLRWNIPW